MDRTSKTVIKAMLDAIKTESFVNSAGVTDAQAMGLLLSQYSGWDGVFILRAAESALEDANFHTDSATVGALADKHDRADDDRLIDPDTRSALFASLNEVYPGIGRDRATRLAKLNKLAGRPASDPIVSLSDRRCNMTNADARRVFDMLNEVKALRALA